jgi:hypothetical protein
MEAGHSSDNGLAETKASVLADRVNNFCVEHFKPELEKPAGAEATWAPR